MLLGHKKRKLANYWINPRYQLRFLAMLAIAIAFPMGASFLVTRYAIHEYILASKQLEAGNIDTLKEITSEESKLVWITNLTYLFHALTMVCIGIVQSHKVAGMVFRLRSTMKDITEGKPTRLHIRQKDEFREIVEEFNGMVDALEVRSKKKTKKAA